MKIVLNDLDTLISYHVKFETIQPDYMVVDLNLRNPI
jgi:hypothetical protein